MTEPYFEWAVWTCAHCGQEFDVPESRGDGWRTTGHKCPHCKTFNCTEAGQPTHSPRHGCPNCGAYAERATSREEP